jgi:glucan 1,3-beta-glucosidase
MFKNNVNVVPVIQPLNEPAGYDGGNMLSTIRQFYYDSYGNVRFPNGNNVQSNTVLMIHDAFQSTSYWSGFMPNPQWQGVILDTHVRGAPRPRSRSPADARRRSTRSSPTPTTR